MRKRKLNFFRHVANQPSCENEFVSKGNELLCWQDLKSQAGNGNNDPRMETDEADE